MNILRKLHVSTEYYSLLKCVICVAGKVKVGKRLARKEITGEHLANELNVEDEARKSGLSAEKEHKYDSEKTRNNEAPPWECGLYP